MPKVCRQCKQLRHDDLFLPKRGNDPVATCMNCRKIAKTYAQSDKGKAVFKKHARSDAGRKAQMKHRKTEKWKATRSRHKNTDRFEATLKEYKDSGRYKEKRQEEYDRTHSDAGLHLQHALTSKMSNLMSGKLKKSKTVLEYSDFKDAEDIMNHFKSLFPSDGSMTFENHGRYTWHVGHRIAKAMYDHSNIDDIRRCWSKINIFPQDAKANLSLNVSLPSDEELIELRDIWPLSWKDKLPSWKRRIVLERMCKTVG